MSASDRNQLADVDEAIGDPQNLRTHRPAARCVQQPAAEQSAANNPDIYSPVWRNERILVGLRVDPTRITHARMRELIELAWRNRAPKRLVTEYDRRLTGNSAAHPAAD
ncbi:hypothetical protein AB0G04_24420 [Actinoplanes sp. NPDC023801]|uniref:hypothetical protein n=1 Tax=Actinoplanes sp. NPDC023801 TaxID=3154595 RepID=UPI0033E7892C